jgi:NADH-quinone oxidoreductase subunit I
MIGPNITEFYPEEMPKLPIRVRSSMGLERSKCISCNMCVMVCPNSVIKLTSEKDETTNKKVLKSYQMDVGRCLFCGMCTEVCPTKAITVTQEFENAIYEPDFQWDMIKRAERKGKVG